MLAGVLGALRLQRRPPEDIRNLRVAVVGAGSAGIGVSQVRKAQVILKAPFERNVGGSVRNLRAAVVGAGSAGTGVSQVGSAHHLYSQKRKLKGGTGGKAQFKEKKGRRVVAASASIGVA